MKSLIALSLALWSALTLTSCVDLAGLDGPGYGGGGYGGGRGGYGGSYGSGYNNGYRPPNSYYNQPTWDNGYRPPNTDHHDHDHHSNSNSNSNYFGGPAEWYKSGYALGKRDRKEKHSCNYRRHNTQYDKKTESQFARGYNEGYH